MKIQRHQKLKFTFAAVGKIAFGLVVAMFSIYLLSSALFGSAFGVAHYTVLTGSMGDKIPQGSMVLVVKSDFYNLQQGDVVAFAVDLDGDGKKETVTHNFAGYEKVGTTTYLITQSEISGKPDSWRIPQADFRGKCVIHVPVLGNISRFLTHPVGKLNLIINTATLLFAIILLSDDSQSKEVSLEALQSVFAQ